jgi:hypothetical protein
MTAAEAVLLLLHPLKTLLLLLLLPQCGDAGDVQDVCGGVWRDLH